MRIFGKYRSTLWKFEAGSWTSEIQWSPALSRANETIFSSIEVLFEYFEAWLRSQLVKNKRWRESRGPIHETEEFPWRGGGGF